MPLFETGNQWWNLRSKHGRAKLFETPELMWEAAQEYFEHTRLRKWTKKDWVGKDAVEVERESEPPFTWSGLCLYLDCSEGYFREFKKDCSADFVSVINRIGQIIYTQKFEGASVGAYNANIIARDLGLREGVNVATPEGESFNVTMNIS